MDYITTIKNRRSVRNFDGNPLKPEEIEDLLNFANGVTTPYEQPVQWYILDAKENPKLTTTVIRGTNTFIAGKLELKPHAEEAFGYAFEQVVLYAAEKGIGTTWIAGTMNRTEFERAVELKEGEFLPCISPLGYPAAKMSGRETLMRKGIKADSREPFEKLFFDGSFDTPLTEEKAGDLKEALEAVRWAPSAANKQPWRLVVTENAVHFYEVPGGFVRNGWDMQKIDIGIALCHFADVCGQLGRNVTFSTEDPDIAAPENTVYIASYTL